MTARGLGCSPPGAPGKGCERRSLVSLQGFGASDPVTPLRPFLREPLLVTATAITAGGKRGSEDGVSPGFSPFFLHFELFTTRVLCKISNCEFVRL